MIRAAEVMTGASQLRFFAGAARLQSGVASGEYAEGLNSQIRREPIGVVGQIVPWNYPFMMLIWKVGPALAAGNTVVLKPSANTPESAIVFAEIASEILPPGVFNLVLGTGETGRLMSAHPVPGLVALTGSVRAGSDLAEQAAGNVTRVHLELGGKAPAVVFADEPTGARDLSSGRTVLEWLRRLVEHGATVVMVTHDAQVAARADRVLVLVDGRIMEDLLLGGYEEAEGPSRLATVTAALQWRRV